MLVVGLKHISHIISCSCRENNYPIADRLTGKNLSDFCRASPNTQQPFWDLRISQPCVESATELMHVAAPVKKKDVYVDEGMTGKVPYDDIMWSLFLICWSIDMSLSLFNQGCTGILQTVSATLHVDTLSILSPSPTHAGYSKKVWREYSLNSH